MNITAFDWEIRNGERNNGERNSGYVLIPTVMLFFTEKLYFAIGVCFLNRGLFFEVKKGENEKV